MVENLYRCGYLKNFNYLSIQEQVNIINKLLGTDKNLSINKICENIGIPSSTLKTRLSKEEYRFNKNKHIYQLQKYFHNKSPLRAHESHLDKIKEYND